MASYLTEAQLRAELARCQFCETRPCRSGCPASLSPADFIMAARCGEPSDYRRAAAHILGGNPLGGVCGSVCPDSLCMARCSRRDFDRPVDIPAIQAAIVRRARALGVVAPPAPPSPTGQRVAIVGAGPAGLGAASVLARAGHAVRVFDRARQPGGMARLIPRDRLDPEVLEADLDGLRALGDLELVPGRRVALPRDLLARGFGAVVVAAGLGEPVRLEVPGAERAHPWTALLGPRPPPLRGRRVAIVGDGPVALDCAHAALARGAAHVELFARKALSELALARAERDRLLGSGVHVSCRVRVTAIRGRGARVTGLALRKVAHPAGQAFHPSRLRDLPHGAHERRDLDAVILAMGAQPGLRLEPHPRVFYAGDLEGGATSVVEALASGKRAGLAVHRLLAGDDLAACPDRTTCADGSGCPRRSTCPEWSRPAAPGGGSVPGARGPAGLPVPLATALLGFPLGSPYLLAPAPAADGYALLRRAYEAGWPGGVTRAAADAERLAREFPDRLTLLSASAPLTDGHGDETRTWEACARALDASGATAVELSVRFPPGLHDPELPARFVDRVLAAGDPRVPKLFKLEPGVTCVPSVLAGVAAVLARHPDKPAGLTLAAPAGRGLVVSCDADPADYRAAASLLAAGASTLQLSRIVRRHGLGILSELQAGLSYFLAERGLRSVSALAGAALEGPGPADAPPREVCALDPALCTGCGSCSRCPHLAIALDGRARPVVDAARCTGCGACVEQCFAGALALRRAA